MGQSPMGFLNPWLYQNYEVNPGIVLDVKYGNNSGGNRLLPTYSSCQFGFNAIPGWDAATGLGSPNFEVMLQQAYDPEIFTPPPPPPLVSWTTVLVSVVIAVCGSFIATLVMIQVTQVTRSNTAGAGAQKEEANWDQLLSTSGEDLEPRPYSRMGT